jgi:hypothetical protein
MRQAKGLQQCDNTQPLQEDQRVTSLSIKKCPGLFMRFGPPSQIVAHVRRGLGADLVPLIGKRDPLEAHGE